jgi:acetyl esterase/lipase
MRHSTAARLGLLTIALCLPPRAWAEERVIPLWPEGVPDARAEAEPEQTVNERVSHVHIPTLTYFPAAGESVARTAVIVCPGGGYQRLAIDHEGYSYARMLNRLGVSAFVLKYRLVEYGHPAPLRDVLRAIRLVRSRAKEFGIRSDRIGVMGSSAGGHLAASAATLFDAPEGRTGAALDSTSARPDFVALLYPVITMSGPHVHAGSRRSLIGEDAPLTLVGHLSVHEQVSKATPPAFLVHTGEDTTVPVENSIMFYEALRRAGVSAEMHLYDKGPHGFGTAPGLGPTSEWPKRLEEWMLSHAWLTLAGSR